MKIIAVTCAVIKTDGMILACQRADRGEHSNLWEFPGGKIEADETPEQCIVRELIEELDIVVQPLQRLDLVEHRYDDFSIILIPFLCKIISGDPKAKVHKAFRWQSCTKLFELNWSAADRILIENNMKILTDCA